MTAVIPRHPVTFAAAVTRIQGALGLAAAQAVGKSESLVYKWAHPDHDAQPNLDQALKLDAAFVLATGDAAPILRVYLQRLEDATAGAAHAAEAPHARLMRVMAEAGEIAADLHKALADGRLAPHERAKLQKDIADAIEQLTAMSRDLDVLGRNGGGR